MSTGWSSSLHERRGPGRGGPAEPARHPVCRRGGVSLEAMPGEPSVVVVAPYKPSLSETFIRAHVERLPANAVLVHGWPPRIGERPILSWPRRALHKAWRMVSGTPTDSATLAYQKVFRLYRPCAVLAEYGTMGVVVLEACRRASMPLVVHFHGFDASVHDILAKNAKAYSVLFQEAAGLIAVSRAMRQKLIALGAPPDKVHYNPCGVDCREFAGADPAEAPINFVAVGRFTPKKAPDATLRAFAKVRRAHPTATLRMIGEGPLLADCRRLASDLGIGDGVTFLGAQPPLVVQEEMRRARCFVQHSVQAVSGDSEGTPVGVIEAGATGLPVISTRHAGIPDVVIEGETGFLVDEHDVEGMAQYMLRVAQNPGLAGRLGRAARLRVEKSFSMERSIGGLWKIIQSCAGAGPTRRA
jgi:glycosyltransferase involved in cell wall biosynthesis